MWCIVVLRLSGDLDIEPTQVGIAKPVKCSSRRLEELLNCFAKFVVLDQHGLDRQPSIKLDVAYRLVIGRVGNRHIKLVAAPLQRQCAVLTHQLLADKILWLGIPVQRAEVEERHAELFCGDIAQNTSPYQLVLNQPGN